MHFLRMAYFRRRPSTRAWRTEGACVDAREAGERIELELLILTRQREMTSSRGVRGGDELDRSAYVLLSRLEIQGPMSVPDFVEAFGLVASTFTRQTSALMRQGLVERTPDPDGGMARKYRITEEGQRRLAVQRETIVDGLTRVVADWPPERRLRFIADLRQFNSDIERLTSRPWPRTDDSPDPLRPTAAVPDGPA
jgi:DNA-binding MarR family transcriptional regulator